MLSQNGYYNKGKEFFWKYICTDIINRADKDKGFTLVDIGCGDGSFLHYLLQELNQNKFNLNKIRLVGVDKYNDYKKYFKHRKIEFILTDFLKNDTEKIFMEKKFNFVICLEVLEHIIETDYLIKLIRKILTDRGILYLSTPNLASYHGRMSLFLGYQPLVTEVSNEYAAFGKGALDRFYSGRQATGKPVHHVRVFTCRALKEFIEYHHFKIIRMYGVDYQIPWLWENIPSIAPVVLCVCQKNRPNYV